MTSQETKTHPELTIVARILQQASIPLTSAQFDQQWTPTQLRTAFQWTSHLSALFLSTDDTSIAHVLTPQRIIRSFLKTHESAVRQTNSNGNGRYNDYRSHLSSSSSPRQPATGILPTEEELLDPSTALQRRLLSNPGLTDMVRVEILTLNGPHQQPGALDSQLTGSSFEINRDALSIIKENALEDLLVGARSHFLQLKQLPLTNLPIQHDDTLANIAVKSIEQRTKARVLFDRIKTSINPVSEVETVLISQLRKYLEVSRSEARELIFLLNEMVIKAIGDGLPINGARQRQVDWESIVDALTRLQDE